MLFLNRTAELARLDRFGASAEGGLVVLYGRRRVGKTRLLLEWVRKHQGLYTVADLSSPDVQRRYFAAAIATHLPGFAEVDYPDWRTLFSRLAREALAARFEGPLVLDELPYLVVASPELPSVLQRFLDHEAREARLKVAVAGSSQRMMQGFVLSPAAPLFGRAREILELRPLSPRHLLEVFPAVSAAGWVELATAWGGIPRYWELAQAMAAEGPAAGAPEPDVFAQIDRLVLDPLGPLHREPDRLLLEEIPSALEARPLLDAIGAGAHRVSEIAGRLGRPATSMARPLDRLLELGLVHRELPFGADERGGKRALYKIEDPFSRLWFRVVAPHRAQLAAGSAATRHQLLAKFWPALLAATWEELCRQHVPLLPANTALGELGPFCPASRWWHGTQPEWDLVAESAGGGLVLLGEAKWSATAFTSSDLEAALRSLASKPAPVLPQRLAAAKQVRALFVPAVAAGGMPARPRGRRPLVVTAGDLLGWVFPHPGW